MIDWRSKEYENFRTGLTFAEVYQELWAEVERGERRHITRATVLGRWHEIKLKMWRYYGENNSVPEKADFP